MLSSVFGQDRIKSDERVVFFPTAGTWNDETREWTADIHGWIYEPEVNDFLRRQLTERILAVMGRGRDWDDATEERLRGRISRFLYDNERSKQLRITIGEAACDLEPSAADGHFTGQVRIPEAVRGNPGRDGTIEFRLLESGEQEIRGTIHLLAPRGLSIVSDVDDTIKVSDVRNRQRLLERTFLEEFVPVEGMAALYRDLADRGATIHYLSNSPCQLYFDLEAFRAEHRFPAGTWSLNRFRLKDPGSWDRMLTPEVSKGTRIEALLRRFPGRQFVLVGDSGERDPEIYGELARTFPEQVRQVWIRSVDETVDREAPRFTAAFREVPADRWILFRDPAVLKESPFVRTLRETAPVPAPSGGPR
ncbi:phosphatidate phosphatase App1 family protein [Planctomyces sp. SH-PL14]|uniref:phosphatidate phosphatase App1 family protein n=1 Tax=Planctomyces sp. SH-PL14 TaxID=1632864 RepID=UPI0018D301E8|nr:phosphatase domain-containing protein [Planctomyces sp. SH-PL14]